MAGGVRSWFRGGSFLWLVCLILALTAVFFAFFAGIFGFYNWVEVWNGQTLRKIYQIGTTTILTLFVAVVGLAVTIVMARYAYATIAEMRKDRRKDTIERMLENLHSPLYEMLRRARHETDDFKSMVIAEWNKKGRGGPRDCVLSEEQLTRVREVVERFGHYMDPVEQALLTKVLANPNSIGATSGERLTQPWHLFLNAEIDPRFDYIKKTRDTLRKELDELIRVSR